MVAKTRAIADAPAERSQLRGGGRWGPGLTSEGWDWQQFWLLESGNGSAVRASHAPDYGLGLEST